MQVHVLFKLLLVAAAYLLGSVPFGVIMARIFAGVDVRAAGSGNIGATNVARTAGKLPGILTLVLDAAKGAIPVACAIALLAPEGSSTMPAWVGAVGLAAFLGHLFPVWLGFKGGKGVATALGVFAVIAPWGALCGVAAFALLFALFRIASVGSLGGALVVLGYVVWKLGPASPLAWSCFAICALIVWRHKANLKRLLKREELKV